MPVHRPPDSRLLADLIAQEKEHAKQLAALFPVVNAALASLSSYATASGPPAQSIAAVVDAFATADDALYHRYPHAIDAWRTQLVALKDLEDDFTAVLRDRDILVTRLLKASKSTRDTHRSSRLLASPSAVGISASSASLPSSNVHSAPASTPTPFIPAPGNTNPKLAQAQSELQACEAHLVAKERELDARRIAVAHDGLGARCRALIDCAAVWAEMGKQGLKALQALSQSDIQNDENLSANSVPTPAPNHLGTHLGYPSDSSSLTPSQSASQTVAHSTEASHESPPQAAKSRSEPKPQVETDIQLPQKTKSNTDAEADMILTIALPPAHAIPELTVPTGVRSRSPLSDDHSAPAPAMQQHPVSKTAAPLPRRRSTRRSRRPPSQHIAEVFEETSDGLSSASHRHPHSHSNDATQTNVATLLALAPRSLSPQVFPIRDSEESEEFNDEYGDPSDGHPDGGPFQVVENDPFDVIRRSMVISPGPSVVLTPVAPNTATDDPGPPKALVSLNTPRARTGLSVPTSARASASAPDVRMSVEDPIAASASKSALGPSSISGLGLGWGPVSGPTLTPAQPAKRERRTSLAFFGSLRGLFRKPNKGQQQKARGAVTEWEDSDGHGSPEPPGRASTGTRVGGNWRRGVKGEKRDGKGGGGWVTRTDARIRGGRRVDEDSDVEAATSMTAVNTATTTTSKMMSTVVDVGRRGSRLRKGKPGALAGLPSTRRGQGHGNGSGSGSGIGSGNGSTISIPVHVSKLVRVDGVGPDSKVMNITSGRGTATDTLTGATLGKSRTARRSTTKRRKTSVAGLRGSDQGQSDGEAIVGSGNEVEQLKANAYPGQGASPPRRTATTPAGTSRLDAAKTKHRRSASLSEVDVQLAMLSSSPTLTQTPTPSELPTRTPSSASSSSPKPHARRQAQVGNGPAHKQHVKNQSLMSIVADVTGQRLRQDDRGGATKSFDVPRVPVPSVSNREVVGDPDQSPVREIRVVGGRLGMNTAIATTTSTNGRGHARSASSPENGRLAAEREQGQGRGPMKMPLRSALRNASRTPSPGPVSVVTPVMRTTTMAAGTVVARGGAAKAGGAEADERNRGRRSWRDSASSSSYATGRESLDGEVLQSRVPSPSDLRSRSPEPSFMIPPPPPVEPPPVVRTAANTTGNGHAHPNATESSVPPSSTVSTETDATAAAGTVKVRRKSVRMSLQPTFSPTPPAMFDEDEEDGEGSAPWSRAFSVKEEGDRARARRRGGGGKKFESEHEDAMWADSSEEDEAYGRARQLLSQSLDVGRAGGGNTHTHPDTKGKARARG